MTNNTNECKYNVPAFSCALALRKWRGQAMDLLSSGQNIAASSRFGRFVAAFDRANVAVRRCQL